MSCWSGQRGEFIKKKANWNSNKFIFFLRQQIRLCRCCVYIISGKVILNTRKRNRERKKRNKKLAFGSTMSRAIIHSAVYFIWNVNNIFCNHKKWYWHHTTADRNACVFFSGTTFDYQNLARSLRNVCILKLIDKANEWVMCMNGGYIEWLDTHL